MIDVTTARTLAISYIGISHKSSGRVREHLLRKDVPEDIAEQAISSLCSDGYIDDLRVAQSIRRLRHGRNAEGLRKLRLRLIDAGIPAQVADDAMQTFPADEETIVELVRERICPDYLRASQFESFQINRWMRKSYNFLLSRGYSSDLALRALREGLRDVE